MGCITRAVFVNQSALPPLLIIQHTARLYMRPYTGRNGIDQCNGVSIWGRCLERNRRALKGIDL